MQLRLGQTETATKMCAPATTAPSFSVFETARSPSLTASLICAITWSLGPLMRMVTEWGLLTFSTKVYLHNTRGDG